jgi:hypothetical protein
VIAHRNRIALGAAISLAAVVGVAAAAAEHGGHETRRPTTATAPGFAWLRPHAAPAGWTMRRLPGSPARLPAPPGWKAEDGDPGTQTVVSRGPSGAVVGYLNATPRQGAETAANWSRFRVDHNRDEGDRDVKLAAAAAGLGFRSGSGSCVIDSYRTETGNRYREIACIVSGRSAATVIVAAAPPSRWAEQAPTIERAIDAFTT